MKFDDVYGGRPPFQAGSLPSEAAAEEIADQAMTQRAQVLAFINSRGLQGATDKEIQLALGMTVSTQVPRRRALVLKGQVKDAGFCRMSTTGRMATVWVSANEPEIHGVPLLQTLRQKYKAALDKIEQLEDELRDCREELRRSRSGKKQLPLFGDLSS